MGWDLKATADTAMNALPQMSGLSSDMTAQQAAGWIFGAILLFGVIAALFKIVPRTWKVIEDTLFSNWRLALLAATGIALSLAGGYRTWDGMRNFTGESVLSLMTTFGIQGVMLIVAWLIGESFATGMSQTRSRQGGAWDLIATALFGILAFTAFGIWAGQGLTTPGANADSVFHSDAAEAIKNYALFGAIGALVIAFLFALSKSDIGTSYVQASRVLVKNAMLWVMFLACMATSVFFSFDSFFTAIFPQEERVRAAELRAQNQVGGIIADIGTTIDSRKVTAAEEFFTTRDNGWQKFERQLVDLAAVAKQSEGAVEKYFHEQAEARNRAVAEQQERITTSQSGQAGLASKKTSLTDELARLKAERPTLAAEYGEKKGDLDARAKEIDSKRVEAMAEEKGVEGTLKIGKGPQWRERIGELGRLNDYYKVGEERVKDAKKRLDAVETRISQIERELAQVDGDLAKLKGEEETASQRISVSQSAVSVDDGKVIDPSRMLPAFEKARTEFRQEPTAERLSDIQKVCSQILGAMLTATPETKAKVGGVDCDPKEAVEAAGVLFALNAGSHAFAANCAGGEKIAGLNSADALFGFARRCLADSGLPSRETDELRGKINFMELNRDDKAHRFVVTWNAFLDGNRLAYLALAIAIGIDALIFMSGLFGANAVRSPLSDVPTVKARSAAQLEATINAALGAHQYETAALTLNALKPITNTDGFSALADFSELHPGVASRVRAVLTAGADIGAVEVVPPTRLGGAQECYRVRSELREYLSSVCDRHLKADATIVQLAKLEQLLREALRPHTHEHADITLNHFEPVSTRGGYTSMVTLGAISDPYEVRVVRRVMNAGAAVEAIATDKDAADRYYVKPDVYRALLLIRANDPPSRGFDIERRRLLLGGAAGDALAGGRLNAMPPPLPPNEKLQLTQFPGNDQRPGEGSDEGESYAVRDLVEDFAMELGVQTEALARYLELAQYVDLPQLRSAMRSVLNQRPAMAATVNGANKGFRDGILQACKLLHEKQRLDAARRAELDSLASAIDNLRPMLLLGRGGAYRHMLANMEQELVASDAEGSLTPDKADLLRYLRSHLKELAAADVGTRAGWDTVLSSLKSFNYWLSTVPSNDRPPAS